jgi:hypothetical protein
MKVKEITVGTSRKLGLPGYSSFDVSAFVTVSLGKNDDVQNAYNKAWATVEKQVIDRVEAKGLESPVAAEAQDEKDPADWLEHASPDEQRQKIKATKKLDETESNLKKEAANRIPSVFPASQLKMGGES